MLEDKEPCWLCNGSGHYNAEDPNTSVSVVWGAVDYPTCPICHGFGIEPEPDLEDKIAEMEFEKWRDKKMED